MGDLVKDVYAGLMQYEYDEELVDAIKAARKRVPISRLDAKPSDFCCWEAWWSLDLLSDWKR